MTVTVTVTEGQIRSSWSDGPGDDSLSLIMNPLPSMCLAEVAWAEGLRMS